MNKLGEGEDWESPNSMKLVKSQKKRGKQFKEQEATFEVCPCI